MQTLSVKDAMVKEEPEFLRQWKVEQEERLKKKDEEETAAKEELLKKAKQELEDWYKRYETQLEKTKSSNREEETKYEDATTGLNHIEPGSEWERVSKHCDFSAKVTMIIIIIIIIIILIIIMTIIIIIMTLMINVTNNFH